MLGLPKPLSDNIAELSLNSKFWPNNEFAKIWIYCLSQEYTIAILNYDCHN